MDHRKVSVVVPTHNRPDMLKRAVESVLDQTYRHLEVVVVDDASSVDVRSILLEFGDPRIKYVRHTDNKGAAASKNTGIRMSTGEYIAFLDDDDVYEDEKIERQVEVFQNSPSNVGVVYCGCTFVDEDNGRRFVYEPRGRYKEKFYLRDFTAATCLVERECFQRVGLFDETLECLVDFDMTLRISEFYDYSYCKEPLYEAHIHHDGRITDDFEKMIMALDRIYSKLSKRIDLLPVRARNKAYSIYHQERGDFLQETSRVGESKREFWQSILLDPFNVKSWTLFLTSLGGPKSYRFLERMSCGLGRKGILP